MSNVINFDVYKNTLRRSDGNNPVSSESGYTEIVCKFKEGDDWSAVSGGIITAGFFVSEETVYSAGANLNNLEARFKIPGQLVGNRNPIHFGITGSYSIGNNQYETIATNVVTLDVIRGVIVDNLQPAEPGQNPYQQLLSVLNDGLTSKLPKLDEGNADEIITSKADGEVQRSGVKLSDKANTSDVYTKSEVDTALAGKASMVGGGASAVIITATGSGDIQRSDKSFANSIGEGSTSYIPTTKAVKDALDEKADSADIPTKTSQLQNDSGFLTQHQSLSNYYNKSEVDTALLSKADAEHTHSEYVTDSEMQEAIDSIDVDLDESKVVCAFNGENDEVIKYLSKEPQTDAEYANSNVNTALTERCDIPGALAVDVPTNTACFRIVDCESGYEWKESVSDESFVLRNLIPGRLYRYYALKADGSVLGSGCCVARGQVRMIDVPKSDGTRNAFNMRDLGGWACNGGRIKYGLIFRGARLNGRNGTSTSTEIVLDSAQKSYFKNILGIEDEVDLRTSSEVTHDNISASALDGVGYYRKAVGFYEASLNDTRTANYKDLLEHIAGNLEAGKVTYLHCVSGADRTAQLCFFIEVICGMSLEDIEKDFELTAYAFENGAQLSSRRRNYSDGSGWKTFMQAINALGDENDTLQEKVIGFLTDIGVTAATISTIKEKLVEHGVPTRTSQLINDSGFLTSHQSLANYYNKTEVDNALLGKAASEHTHSQYLTTHQDISGKEDTSNKVGSLTQGITGRDTTVLYPNVKAVKDYVSGELESYALESEIPENTSELNNDSGFLTQHQDISGKYEKPSGGIPKTDLSSEVQTSLGKADSALQAHQSLSNYYTKSDVNNMLDGKANSSHTHSQYLTQHQDITGKADASSVYTKSQVDAMLLEAGGANVVSSVSEMTDTSRLYVLAETGHVWRYSSTTVEPPNELDVKYYNRRFSGSAGIDGTTSSGAGTFINERISIDLTGSSCIVTLKNFAANMGTMGSNNYGNSRIMALDANGDMIAGSLFYISRRASNEEWLCPISGSDCVGDLVTYADTLVTLGKISNKSQIKYVIFAPTISTSSISSTDVANLGIYISTHGGTTSAWVDTGIVYGGGNEAAIAALDTRVTAAENNIAALASADDAVIPDYWQTEVDDTVSKIKALQDAGGHDLLCFGWCSDMHIPSTGTAYEQNIGAVAARVMKECNIPLLLMTGDMLTADTGHTASTAVTAYKKAWEYLAPVGAEKVLAVKGNHDAWFGSDGNGNNYVYGLSPDELHRHIFAPQEKDLRRVFGDDGSYFYVDNVPQKTRFICLNSQWAEYEENQDGTAKYSSQKGAGFGQDQLDWLIDEALDVGAGYSVIIALHVPPTAGTHSSYSGAYREYAVIRGVIDAYAGKTTYSGTYTHSSSGTAYKQEGTWADVSVSCDFSSYHGTLLALFCGHTHYDQAVTNDLAVPIVCITSAINTPYDAQASTRVLGTKDETAFDFVCINRRTGAINLIRCGYGSDRTIS